jgi:epoxyqueuosine reductase QueG
MDTASLSQNIRNLADSIGIDILGFTHASEFSGYAIRKSKRRDPKLSLPDAKTILVAGIYIGGVRLPAWESPWYGRTSRLYLSQYFLNVVEPLEPIVALLEKEGYQALICDDSIVGGSILPLKLAAIRAGFGWQGKHSLLISKKYGTFLALGGILTNAVLEHNTVEEPNRCVKCDYCQIACPMKALDQPHVLRRSRCLSHLLQEENLPKDAQAVMVNRVIDCEICQEACPWNKKHIKNPLTTTMTETFQKNIEEWERFFSLPNLVNLSKNGYRKKLGPLATGIPYHIIHRNASIALERAANLNEMPGEDQNLLT